MLKHVHNASATLSNNIRRIQSPSLQITLMS